MFIRKDSNPVDFQMGFPLYFIVDRNGIIRYLYSGGFIDAEYTEKVFCRATHS